MAAYHITNQGDHDFYPTVARVTPQCPRCESQRSRSIGRSRGREMHYHRCLECGQKFRSIEVVPPPLETKKN